MLDLKKNDIVTLDLKKDNITKIDIGLGWDTRADLDVHAVLRNEKGTGVARVYFSNLAEPGVSLSGDNMTGAGSGDDETIYINKDRLEGDIKRISIYVNIYSGLPNFRSVKGGYIRILNGKTELAKAKLDVKEIANNRAVHFAELLIEDSIKFKVVMQGGELTPLFNNYDISEHPFEANNVISEEKPKRKKFLGIF